MLERRRAACKTSMIGLFFPVKLSLMIFISQEFKFSLSFPCNSIVFSKFAGGCKMLLSLGKLRIT